MVSRKIVANLKLVAICVRDALAYPPKVIGIAKVSIKIGKVPSLPGNMKSNKDQSSLRLFCKGDPKNTAMY